jgi:plastocyanin
MRTGRSRDEPRPGFGELRHAALFWSIPKELTMKRMILVAALLLFGASAAVAAPKQVTVTIQHQTRGCHAWAVGHGAYGATHAVTVARGATLKFVNNDVMPQKIVLKSGPHVSFVGKPNLAKPAASVKVVFAKAGVYTFGTIAGEDYFKGVKTVGEDNVLKLVVTVK